MLPIHKLFHKLNASSDFLKRRSAQVQFPYKSKLCSHKGRVVVTGMQKTGTTSMTDALKELKYRCYVNSCRNWPFTGVSDVNSIGNPHWYRRDDVIQFFLNPKTC